MDVRVKVLYWIIVADMYNAVPWPDELEHYYWDVLDPSLAASEVYMRSGDSKECVIDYLVERLNDG